MPARTALTKIDLGAEWQALTGLPFVYAMWSGRDGRRVARAVAALQAARDRGVAHVADIAREDGDGDPRARGAGARYLRDNLKYGLGEREVAGLAAVSRAGRGDRPGAGAAAACGFTHDSRLTCKAFEAAHRRRAAV